MKQGETHQELSDQFANDTSQVDDGLRILGRMIARRLLAKRSSAPGLYSKTQGDHRRDKGG